MKFIILKTNLKEGLFAIERAVSESITLPILKNILLKAENGKIILIATNLEIAARHLVPGKIIEEGSLTIPFSTLYSIVTNVDVERIHVETDGMNLIVKTDTYEARIQGMKSEDFPIIPHIESRERYIKINSTLLCDAFLKIISAAQYSEIRPEISGILFDFQLTTLKMVATDSFRLTEKTLLEKEFEGNFENGFRVIIPLRTINEVMRTFPADRIISLFVDSHQILFATDDHELISRIITGKYPDYEQIIPRSIESELTLNREKFVGAVKLVASFSGKVNDVKVRLGEDGKVLEVYSANQYLGENRYLIPIKLKGSSFTEVSFNWRYLLDGLKQMQSEYFTFGISGDSKPAVLRSLEDASYFYILMPVKTA